MFTYIYKYLYWLMFSVVLKGKFHKEKLNILCRYFCFSCFFWHIYQYSRYSYEGFNKLIKTTKGLKKLFKNKNTKSNLVLSFENYSVKAQAILLLTKCFDQLIFTRASKLINTNDLVILITNVRLKYLNNDSFKKLQLTNNYKFMTFIALGLVKIILKICDIAFDYIYELSENSMYSIQQLSTISNTILH